MDNEADVYGPFKDLPQFYRVDSLESDFACTLVPRDERSGYFCGVRVLLFRLLR